MSSAASAAIAPNTPSAIDSGSMARSAFATATDVCGPLAESPGRTELRDGLQDLGQHRGHVAAAAVDLDVG